MVDDQAPDPAIAWPAWVSPDDSVSTPKAGCRAPWAAVNSGTRAAGERQRSRIGRDTSADSAGRSASEPTVGGAPPAATCATMLNPTVMTAIGPARAACQGR